MQRAGGRKATLGERACRVTCDECHTYDAIPGVPSSFDSCRCRTRTIDPEIEALKAKFTGEWYYYTFVPTGNGRGFMRLCVSHRSVQFIGDVVVISSIGLEAETKTSYTVDHFFSKIDQNIVFTATADPHIVKYHADGKASRMSHIMNRWYREKRDAEEDQAALDQAKPLYRCDSRML